MAATTTDPIVARTLSRFLHEVGAKQPAPGGGAVAGVAGALASALGRMVAAYSVGKKGLENEQATIERIEKDLGKVQSRLMELADADAQAYGVLNALMKLDADHPERASIGEAAAAAAGVPLEVVRLCARTLELAEELAPRSNRWLGSDLAITAILADAGARSASWMVEANLDSLREHAGDDAAQRLHEDCASALSECAARLERVLGACGG